MDIWQIKKDLENGVIVSRGTYEKLLAAALVMKSALENIDSENGDPIAIAAFASDFVEAL